MIRFAVPLSFALILVTTGVASAQQNANSAQLRVTVIDETGGWIPIAVVRIGAAAGAPIEKVVDDRGVATFTNLGVGSVPVHVEAGGFSDYNGTLTLRRGINAQNITLKI